MIWRMVEHALWRIDQRERNRRHAGRKGFIMPTAAEKRVAEMRRHDAMVNAVHEAIDVLEAPFAEGDEKPGTIVDAIEILRAALRG